jgi:GTP-binding protein
MKIKYSKFITSATNPKQYPEHPLAEVAFIGKSNVGKSSLINMLLERKGLAKVSSTPGKTTLINFFDVNGELSFVDLPGYGYAGRSKKEQQSWGVMIETYLSIRKNLVLFFLLLDIRRIPVDSDLQILTWLKSYTKDFAIILTKADKLNQKERNQQIKKISEVIKIDKENFFVISSLKRTGKDDVLKLVETTLRKDEYNVYREVSDSDIERAKKEIKEEETSEDN